MADVRTVDQIKARGVDILVIGNFTGNRNGGYITFRDEEPQTV